MRQKSYPTLEIKELFAAILQLKNTDESARFFRDLLTLPELTEVANRWQIVKMVLEKKPYLKIAQKLNVSTTTVTRVAHWVKNGEGGYQLIAKRLFKK